MTRIIDRIIFVVMALAMIVFLVDIVIYTFFEVTLLSLWADRIYVEHPLVKRIEALVGFFLACILILNRTKALQIVTSVMDRLERTLQGGEPQSSSEVGRPSALLAAMILLLGVIPVLLYMFYDSFFFHNDFFIWLVGHSAWVVYSTVVLVGLVKRRLWAYVLLFVTCIANILLAGSLATFSVIRLGQPFYGPHGFAALNEIGVFIGLLILIVYIVVCLAITVYLVLRRRGLTPPVQTGQVKDASVSKRQSTTH